MFTITKIATVPHVEVTTVKLNVSESELVEIINRTGFQTTLIYVSC